MIPNICVERERERERDSPPLPLKADISLDQKLWVTIDYGEKVDKSDTRLHIDLHAKVSTKIAFVNHSKAGWKYRRIENLHPRN